MSSSPSPPPPSDPSLLSAASGDHPGELTARRPPIQGPLPPVEPPTFGFILQLFVIPLVIVSIIVVIWLLFNWLAHMGSDPAELARELKSLDDSSWQKALTLADQLRNPQYAHLKRDPGLARELAGVLEYQIEQAQMKAEPVRLRTFLCRALGEFQTPEPLPALLRAAAVERDPAEAEVRLSALQSLAVFINQNHPEALRDHPELTATLLAASREPSGEGDTRQSRGEVRSQAAFALGVLGGPAAVERLEVMLGDAYPNARYNAATGLCRAGDRRALPVLLEMIDPKNVEAIRYEEGEETRAWKRLTVMQNGLRAAAMLSARSPAAIPELQAGLQKVLDSDLEEFEPGTRRGIRIAAEEAQMALRQRPGS